MLSSRALGFSVIVLLGTLACEAGHSPVLAAGATDRALAGFSGSLGDTWSYGYGAIGKTFTYYDTFADKCSATKVNGLACWQTINPDAWNAIVQINSTGAAFKFGGSTVAVTNALLLHPGQGLQDSIVRWTSHATGTYHISGFFEILADCPSGTDAKIFAGAKDLTATAFNSGNGSLTGPGANLNTLTPGQKKTFSLTRSVKKGDTISFGINAAGDNFCDTTGFDAAIELTVP